MSRRIDNQDVPRELAHRAGDGLEIVLLWDEGDGLLRVVVDDSRTGQSFELTTGDGGQALDAFYHPFAHAAAGGLKAAPAMFAPSPP